MIPLGESLALPPPAFPQSGAVEVHFPKMRVVLVLLLIVAAWGFKPGAYYTCGSYPSHVNVFRFPSNPPFSALSALSRPARSSPVWGR